MLSRAAKPKLSLSVSTATQQTRPSLSLKSPVVPRTPISPSPISPTARNTRMNIKGYSTFQQPSYSYSNSSKSKSILKKGSASSASSTSSKKLQISPEPIVYCVTPIEAGEEYYGGYVKMSRDERRWTKRSYE
jgi:hypothetical protein